MEFVRARSAGAREGDTVHGPGDIVREEEGAVGRDLDVDRPAPGVVRAPGPGQPARDEILGGLGLAIDDGDPHHLETRALASVPRAVQPHERAALVLEWE